MATVEPLQYRVVPARPEAHLFEVALEIPESGAESLVLRLPAWIPGSYMIRDFARNLLRLEATQAAGEIRVEKLDKQTWRLSGVAGAVRVDYAVHAGEFGVRAAHLDGTHGYFNGTSLFLAVRGFEDRPCRLELLPPPAAAARGWQVATSLRCDGAPPWGFGGYRADDYADLIDHPVEMGRFERVEFGVGGVAHAMAVSGRFRADLARLGRDLPRICAEHAALFGELPIDRYLFLTQLVGDGYGGLEHRFSSSLMASREDLPEPLPEPAAAEDGAGEEAPVGEGYRRFLGLCSHEYFHLWNVKRIRPRVFAENGLEREVHTRLLWAFEGITSYYDDLALVRSGVIGRSAYLTLLAGVITRVLRTPGRRLQTVAESSFDAWTRFYKQDENAPNAIVSYYAKGALTALALDLTLRARSEGACSLDTVMRALWQRYGRTGVGVGERDIEALAGEVSGLDLSAFFAQALDSTEDLDLAGLLASVGVAMRLRPAAHAKDLGGAVEAFAPAEAPPDIGVRLQPDSSEARLAAVLEGRPAQRAGLSPGDVVVAVDGLRASAANLDGLIRRAAPAAPVPVHAFRRDELMLFELQPEPAPADTCELRLIEDAAPAVRAARCHWLASAAAAG